MTVQKMYVMLYKKISELHLPHNLSKASSLVWHILVCSMYLIKTVETSNCQYILRNLKKIDW